MFDTVCTLPLSSELFALAAHPSRPHIAVGLAAGHVAVLQLPPESPPSSHSSSSPPDDDSGVTGGGSGGGGRVGKSLLKVKSGDGRAAGHIDTVWRTRRHKGSCRALAYGHGGGELFSAGSEGIVKVADCGTGIVGCKIAVPFDVATGDPDPPSVLHALTPQHLLLGTDSGALHIYDLRQPSGPPSKKRASSATASISVTTQIPTGRPAATHRPHNPRGIRLPGEPISAITPIPPTKASTSGLPKQWLTTSGATLAVTDLRKGPLALSEDQGDELLCCTHTSSGGASGTSTSGAYALAGTASGALAIFRHLTYADRTTLLPLSRDTLDCAAVLPPVLRAGAHPPNGGASCVAVGTGIGEVVLARIGGPRGGGVLGVLRHDEVEGVVGVAFDAAGRMVSGGGRVIKVWHEGRRFPANGAEEAEVGGWREGGEASEDDEDEWEDEDDEDEDDEEDEEEEGGSSDEEEVGVVASPPPKKKRKGKEKTGKFAGGGAHGILAFEGL